MFLGITLLVASITGIANELTSSLSPAQRKLIEAFQLTPAFASQGLAHVDRLLIAQENLRRYGLLQKCDAAAMAGPSAFLDSRYRSAVEQTAANIQKVILQGQPLNLRYMLRRALWASDQLTEQEAAAFLNDLNTPSARLAFATLAELTFLEQFNDMATDIMSGKTNPAGVIWLKHYFRAEGDLQALEAAVAVVAPDALVDLRRVGDFAAHSLADARWLGALTERLQASSTELSAELLARKPAAERAASDWLKRRPFVLLNSAELGAPPLENEVTDQLLALNFVRPAELRPVSEDAVRKAAASIATAYPRPADFSGRLATQGPIEMVGRAADALCAKP